MSPDSAAGPRFADPIDASIMRPCSPALRSLPDALRVEDEELARLTEVAEAFEETVGWMP
jgi:hypothetical protein